MQVFIILKRTNPQHITTFVDVAVSDAAAEQIIRKLFPQVERRDNIGCYYFIDDVAQFKVRSTTLKKISTQPARSIYLRQID
jgi:hypothetical protein